MPNPPPEPDDHGTATLEAARDHARRQVEEHRGSAGPTRPASAAIELPPEVGDATVIWDETIGVGGYVGRRLPRGSVLRIADLGGDACVQLLAYNAHQTAERLNVADTVKVQWQAYLDTGALLLSDMGRVLMTIIEDTSARHDCLCGVSNARTNTARYADGSASGPTPNARDLLALAGLKHGLSRVDIGPGINLFKGAVVEADGALRPDLAATAPCHVVLRAELDVILLVAATPHVLDARPGYDGSPVRFTAWRPPTAPEPDEDPLRHATPERHRAFLNTDDHLLELA